jgi:hypothetical protein
VGRVKVVTDALFDILIDRRFFPSWLAQIATWFSRRCIIKTSSLLCSMSEYMSAGVSQGLSFSRRSGAK